MISWLPPVSTTVSLENSRWSCGLFSQDRAPLDNRSEYGRADAGFPHQLIKSINHGTLAEWLTRCPAKAIPSGACVRITQVSISRFFCFLARHSVHTVSQSAQSIFCYQKAACDFFGFAKGQLVPERACGQCNNSTWYTCATVDRWSIDISEKGISRGIS